MPFDWGKFNKTIKKKFGGKGKKSGGKKTGGGGSKGNAWRAYVTGKKR
jgi:hypothetical protein